MASLRRSKSDQNMKKASKRRSRDAQKEPKLAEEPKINGEATVTEEIKTEQPAENSVADAPAADKAVGSTTPQTQNAPVAIPSQDVSQTDAEPPAKDNKEENEKEEEKKEMVDIEYIIDQLENFAPLSLAENGDNVGLIIGPSSPHKINKILLTTDVTEEVVREAVDKDVQFIVSYNSPITDALLRVSSGTATERVIVNALEKRVAVYTPHTAWETVKGGVNDWLVSAFGFKDDSTPIQPCFVAREDLYRLEVVVGKPNKSDMQEIFKESKANHARYEKTHNGSYCFSAVCSKQELASILAAINKKNLGNGVQITELWKEPISQSGLGRFVKLENALSISECIKNIKTHLGVENLQVALGNGKSMDSLIESVAVCAGEGGKVLRDAKADLFVTGSMANQDIIAAANSGITVVTCDASTTERGFLNVAKTKLEAQFDGKVTVILSEFDRNPLKTV